MFKWTALLSTLVLAHIAIASPTPESFEKHRSELKDHAVEFYSEFLKYSIHEIRGFMETVLAKHATGFEDEVKAYKHYLETTKDFEKSDFEKWAQYFAHGTELLPFDTLDALDHEDKITEFTHNSFAFHYYEEFYTLTEKIAMKFFKCVEKFSYEVRDYLKELKDEYKKREVHMIYWYDRWMHVRDFSKRFEMIGEFFEIFESPKTSEEIYAYKLQYSFKNYTKSLKHVAESVHEEKFVKALEHVEKLMSEDDFDAVPELMKFYEEFDKWLVSKGPSYFHYKKEVFKYTIQFFDDIDFYTELYFEYAEPASKLFEWFEDLKKTETFEESYAKYFHVYSIFN